MCPENINTAGNCIKIMRRRRLEKSLKGDKPEMKKLMRFCMLSVLLLLLAAAAGCGPKAPIDPPAPIEPLAPIDPPGAGLLETEPPPLPPQLKQTGNEDPPLLVYMHEEGVVREMTFEEYIAGVVAGEMKPTWPVEALAAQAIIARTFTLQKIAAKGGVPERSAHASTDIEEFQAYSAADITDAVRKAVKMTRGRVACYDDKFIRGWFSAYAGPRTAEADEGLGYEGEPPPYIRVIDNPGQEIIPEKVGEWAASFPLERVRNRGFCVKKWVNHFLNGCLNEFRHSAQTGIHGIARYPGGWFSDRGVF